jgi:hypothetical protein
LEGLAMSRLGNFSKRIILATSLITLAITSFNCYQEVMAPEPGPPVVLSSPTNVRVSSESADPVRIYFQAIITKVRDKKSKLEETIQVKETIDGVILYDDTSIDLDPDLNLGHYMFDAAQSRIDMAINDRIIRSSYASVDIAIDLINDDRQGDLHDACSLLSLNNEDILPGVKINNIEIILEDDTATNLSSDKLHGTSPFLANWQTKHVIKIQGKGWGIDATITSFSDGKNVVKQTQKKMGKKQIKQPIERGKHNLSGS